MTSTLGPGGPSAAVMSAAAKTPLMRQYLQTKQEHPDSFLFFRMGDFYELFFDDAVSAAQLLGLTLTSRNKQDPDPIPMCGFPWHQRDGYVARLLRLGHKVAICDQLEDPAQAKGLVQRGVTEVLTPGSVTRWFRSPRNFTSSWVSQTRPLPQLPSLSSSGPSDVNFLYRFG